MLYSKRQPVPVLSKVVPTTREAEAIKASLVSKGYDVCIITYIAS